MRIEREKLLTTLTTAKVGTSKKEILEQSHSFVFTEDKLITFNGEILTIVDTPCPEIVGAVHADDMLSMLSKFPDDEVDLEIKGEELQIKAGKKRSAGLVQIAGAQLPYEDVPKPKKWAGLVSGLMGTILQAARVCGRDETRPRMTEVHVTEKAVEASDNDRLFRSVMETELPELLIPATSIEVCGALAFEEVATRGGWFHLKTKQGHQVSIRCSSGVYPEMEPLFIMENSKKIQLPGNLPDILSRAQVMQETTFDAMVSITIKDGVLTLKAQKEAGWYKESKKVEYKGDPIRFEVNPKFLEEILTKTRNVRIGGNRMRIKAGETVFIVSLEVPEEN